jgi:hypothetical protein
MSKKSQNLKKIARETDDLLPTDILIVTPSINSKEKDANKCPIFAKSHIVQFATKTLATAEKIMIYRFDTNDDSEVYPPCELKTTKVPVVHKDIILYSTRVFTQFIHK